MAYVTIRGRAPNRMQLSQYARFVRGMSGLGMGQDGTDLSSLPVGGMSPTDTSLIGLAPPSGSDVLGSLGINISGLDPTAVPGAVAAASAPSSGGGFNLSTFLNSLTGSAASAAKLYQQLQGPSLVAGTNAIYNPATGQYYNPTTGQVVNPGGVSTLGLPSVDSTQLLLYGGIAVGAIVLISMLGKH